MSQGTQNSVVLEPWTRQRRPTEGYQGMNGSVHKPAIRAELKAWLDGCVVPLLVREFLEGERKKGLEVMAADVAKSTAKDEFSAEVLQ
jgi:hypothetical protein